MQLEPTKNIILYYKEYSYNTVRKFRNLTAIKLKIFIFKIINIYQENNHKTSSTTS